LHNRSTGLRAWKREARRGAGSNEAVVRAMLAAWSRLDPDEIASFFTDDIVYDNIPMRATHG